MAATLIDGKALAEKLLWQITQEVQKLKSKGIQPGLAFVLVGEHPASLIYVNNKKKACDEVGIANFLDKLPANISQADLLGHIEKLNSDPRVHGILVQLPLPKQLNTTDILVHIHPKKDVDGLHPMSGLKPCTPQAVVCMIESTGTDIKGKDACVVGRSAIVGRPTASLLVQKDATVTLCHSHTKNLPEKVGAADIVVAAVGKPNAIQGNWIKKGAIVIDVGINRLPDGKIVGDVDFESAKERAGFITPVPGGVGPMTIAMLLKNTVEACNGQTNASL